MISVGQHRPLHPHKISRPFCSGMSETFSIIIAFTRQGYRACVSLYARMIRLPLQVRVPNRTVDQIVDVSISQPRRNLEVFSVVSDALISPEKWTAHLAQTLGEMKIVNIKPLRWSLCDRAGCTYCLKSLIGKWHNCNLMHPVRSFHLCNNSGLLSEVSPLRGSPDECGP